MFFSESNLTIAPNAKRVFSVIKIYGADSILPSSARLLSPSAKESAKSKPLIYCEEIFAATE